MECFGVTCVLQNAGEEGSAPLRLLKRLAHFTYLTDMLRDHVTRAAVPAMTSRRRRNRATLPLSHRQRRTAVSGMEFGNAGTGVYPIVLSTRNSHDAPHLQPAQCPC